MDTQSLEGGFTTPPTDAARAFRAVMEAVARPGTIHTISGGQPPAPMSVAAGTVLLTLCDADTPLYLAGTANTQAMRDWVAFHLGAPLVGASDAMFALGTWDDLAPHNSYLIGTPEYPDRSATLIVEMPELRPSGTHLTGPGIKDSAALNLPDPDFCARNATLFPLGLDLIFTCGDRVAALPRSTRIGQTTPGPEVN